MSQPGIAAYATRITRRQAALQKQQVLDRDNSNIISISGDAKCPVSPRKSDQKTPELHESSPAKIRKTADKPLQVKEKPKTTRGRKKEPTPKRGETIQAAFQRQLEVLKSPTKPSTTPDKFKLTPIDDLSPETEKPKVPTIRRALKFDAEIPETAKTSAVLDELKPIMGGTVKRGRAANSQPASPSAASPSIKKRNLFDSPKRELTTKEVFNSPKKAPPSPLTSPKKLETRSRAQIMLEEIVGKKKATMTKDVLRKQLEKSGKANELKAKLAELSKINDDLRQIGSPKKKSTIARAKGPTPTPLAADAPCYVKYRHLAEKGVMDTMQLPAHYELLRSQFESNDQTVATLYNRGESCLFTKLAQAVKRVLSREFGVYQLEQIMAVAPDSYQIQWKKGLYDAKKGSARIKSSDYQLVLNPILENDENDSGEGAVRMSLAHMKKRNVSFRKTLLGIVKDLHEKFCASIGVDISKKTIKRWHPQFKLEECHIIKPAKIPQKPGTEDGALSAIELLEKMGDKLPEKAKAKLAARTKELEAVELEKIKVDKSAETKSKIPAHILAKIKAKQAARAEEVAENKASNTDEINLLERTPQAASMLRSYFITEKKSCFPFDSACKKVQRSWKVSISISSVEQMLTKVHEMMPKLFDIRVVVGVKYIKILDKKVDPNTIESQCREQIKSIKN